MVVVAPWLHPTARASKRRTPHRWSGSPASPWDGSARPPRSVPSSGSHRRDAARVSASPWCHVALELRPDASERRQRSVVVEGDVRAIGRAARRRTEIDIAGCQAARALDLKPWEAAVDRLNVGGGSNGAIIRPRPFIPALASQGQRRCHSLVGLEIRKRGRPAIRFSDSGNIN